MYLSFLQGHGARTSTGTPRKSNTSQQPSKTVCPEQKISPGTKRPAGGGEITGSRGGKKAKTKEIKEECDKVKKKPKTSGGQRPKNSKRRSIASKVSYKEESESGGEREEEGEGLSEEEEFQATSEDSEGGAKSTKWKKGRGKSKPNVTNTAASKERRSDGGNKQFKDEEGKEWEEEEDEKEEGTMHNQTNRRSVRKNKGPGADEWLEVFLVKTSSWLCVDVERGVGMPHLCSQNATAPITYVVSVDGNGFLKDLGRKYDPTWLTFSRKRRVDEEWWEETLGSFLGFEDERDKKEEKEVRSFSPTMSILLFSQH